LIPCEQDELSYFIIKAFERRFIVMENKQTCLRNRLLGSLLILLGVLCLSIKGIREFVPVLQPYSFGIFMVSPILLIGGFKLMCWGVKGKVLDLVSNILFGLALIYGVVLSFSWYTINIM
jgi:hypothetical protein